MKVAELIELLKTCPPDADVFTAYDSFVCTYEVKPERIILVEENAEYQSGVYLCAMDEDGIQWHLEKKNPPGRLIVPKAEAAK